MKVEEKIKEGFKILAEIQVLLNKFAATFKTDTANGNNKLQR